MWEKKSHNTAKNVGVFLKTVYSWVFKIPMGWQEIPKFGRINNMSWCDGHLQRFVIWIKKNKLWNFKVGQFGIFEKHAYPFPLGSEPPFWTVFFWDVIIKDTFKNDDKLRNISWCERPFKNPWIINATSRINPRNKLNVFIWVNSAGTFLCLCFQIHLQKRKNITQRNYFYWFWK